jgi:hypothetical protein
MTRYCSYNGPARTYRWTKIRRFLGRSCRPATAPSWRSRRSVASIIGTSGARPERRSPPTRGARAGVHARPRTVLATTPPTSRRARPSQHLTSSSPSSTRRDDVPNDISVRQQPQLLDDARGLSISRKMHGSATRSTFCRHTRSSSGRLTSDRSREFGRATSRMPA